MKATSVNDVAELAAKLMNCCEAKDSLKRSFRYA